MELQSRGHSALKITCVCFCFCFCFFLITGGAAIGVPGEIAGFWKAHQLYGKLEWKTLFEPSIRMARQGFQTTPSLAVAVARRIDDITDNPLLR